MKKILVSIINFIKFIFKSIIDFFKETYIRLKAKSPDYFNKIKVICISLTAAGVYLKSNNIDFEINLFIIKNISFDTLLIGSGSISTFIASLAKKDSNNNQINNS